MDRLSLAEFAALPFLDGARDARRWTFTAMREDENGKMRKVPVDARHFVSGGYATGWRGAFLVDRDGNPNDPWLSLSEMASEPTLARVLDNAMLSLNQPMGDGFVVLDVEPDCPDWMKADFLALPWVYAEVSMSGRGLHLVFPSPSSKPEILMAKTALKPLDRNDWELLLNHYVTFTMRPVCHDPSRPVRPMADFEKIWQELADCARIRERLDMDAEDLPSVEDIPRSDRILSAMQDVVYQKKPADFGGDMSRYEFGFATTHRNRLGMLLAVPPFSEHEYTDRERLVLLHECVKEKLPWREKHDEFRGGMSVLMQTCYNCMVKDAKE